MATPRLALAVIGDEIGPSLQEMISFAAEHGVHRLDMRTVDGRNLLGMSFHEVSTISRALHQAGIVVPTLVSPVLKWAAPHKPAATGKVDFAFDPDSCPAPDPIAHAFDIAKDLGAGKIRVFSFLRYPGFHPADLTEAVERLMDFARRYDILVEVENEPVCNVGSLAELAAFFRSFDTVPSHLRPLIDIGNTWSMGQPPSAEDIAFLAPMVDLIHLKDRDFTARRAVPLGDGGVPWADELRRLLQGVSVPEVTASLEIHCFNDGRNAVARSIAALRRIGGEIGAEVV